MRAQINDDQWIYFDNISAHEEDVLAREFSVAKPGIFVDPSQLNLWDGVIRKYNRKYRRVARPYLRMLREVCANNKLPLEIVDHRQPWPYPVMSPDLIKEDFLPGITLEQYQLDALHRALKSECGILQLPTGSGKTEVMAGICKAIVCPTLIVSNQRIVLDQIKARFELRDVNPEIGLFYAGKRPNGELIVVGSIQSLSPPPKLNTPVKEPEETIEEYQRRYGIWEKRLKGQETRKKNLQILLEYARNAAMIIVDECDLAGSHAYAHLFRHYFRGRRRYGLCLSGDSTITTINGERRLDSFDDNETVVVLSSDGITDTWQSGTVVRAGYKEEYRVVFSDGSILRASGDHRVADQSLCYTRVADLVQGQIVKICNDRFINQYESLTNFFSKFNTTSDFGQVSWQGLKFSRANFDQCLVDFKINDVSASSVEFIADSRRLIPEIATTSIKELHHKQFIRRMVVESVTQPVSMISGLEFGGESQSPTGVPFGQRLADFFPDQMVVDRVAAEFTFETIQHTCTDCRMFEDTIDSIAIDHGLLDSFDQFPSLHRVFNTISSETGTPGFGLVIKGLAAVSSQFDRPSFSLVCINGKPILYTMLFKHFLFVGFERSFSTSYDVRKLLNALRAQMLTELPDLISGSISWALENIRALVTLDSNQIMVSCPILLPLAADNHDFTPVYLCEKAHLTVSAVEKTDHRELMWDVVGVTKNSNFYVNQSTLVHNSGTPFDIAKPVERLVIQEHLGSIIYTEGRDRVLARGRINECEFVMLAIDGNPKESSAYDIAYSEQITYNVKLHNLILNMFRNKPNDEGTLILVDKRDLGFALEKIFNDNGITAHFIYGESSKKKRDEALRGFEAREFRVLIGSKILNRGLDLKGGCENLFIATGGKLSSALMQQIGRALRKTKSGTSMIYDLYFRCNKHLYDHSKQRLKAVVAEGFPCKIIFPGGAVAGADLLKSRFRVNPKLLVKEGHGPKPAIHPVH